MSRFYCFFLGFLLWIFVLIQQTSLIAIDERLKKKLCLLRSDCKHFLEYFLVSDEVCWNNISMASANQQYIWLHVFYFFILINWLTFEYSLDSVNQHLFMYKKIVYEIFVLCTFLCVCVIPLSMFIGDVNICEGITSSKYGSNLEIFD